MNVKALKATELYHPCHLEQLGFETTQELEWLTEIVGQPRAVEALCFGVEIQREGYHVFMLGLPGTGKRALVRQLLEKRTANEPAPPSCCYVNNFDQPYKPVALQLPAGKGQQLRKDMEQLIEEVQTDFNLIKPGALHRANGGYLILDARRILMQPLAWEALKRALQAREVRIEPRQKAARALPCNRREIERHRPRNLSVFFGSTRSNQAQPVWVYAYT